MALDSFLRQVRLFCTWSYNTEAEKAATVAPTFHTSYSAMAYLQIPPDGSVCHVGLLLVVRVAIKRRGSAIPAGMGEPTGTLPATMGVVSNTLCAVHVPTRVGNDGAGYSKFEYPAFGKQW